MKRRASVRVGAADEFLADFRAEQTEFPSIHYGDALVYANQLRRVEGIVFEAHEYAHGGVELEYPEPNGAGFTGIFVKNKYVDFENNDQGGSV